jgi:hypothetical protein
MFGFLFKRKKKEQVNLNEVAEVLARRFWEYEMVDGKPDTIVVLGKYRHNRRDFYRLYLQFIGGNTVRFKDARGNIISEVPRSQMFVELKEIMNVL